MHIECHRERVFTCFSDSLIMTKLVAAKLRNSEIKFIHTALLPHTQCPLIYKVVPEQFLRASISRC